jgi:ABC-type hemin transport system substrate-binding protein
MSVALARAGITASTNEATITANALAELRTERLVALGADIAECILTYGGKLDVPVFFLG